MVAENTSIQGSVCPLPLHHDDKIVIGHGSGGKLTHDLISSLFSPHLSNPILEKENDGAIFQLPNGSKYTISTDSHVVTPLFFPGGDIGRLAVCGTVNDIAMMGARPLYLSAGFILEEGLPMDLLEKVIISMKIAADEAGIQIIAADTKVVNKGKADGLYINTSGIGVIDSGIDIDGSKAQPGDYVILSGPMGNHGIAVLAARGDLGFQTDVESDVAPLNHLVGELLAFKQAIHVLRDPTRGGVATSLNEIANQSEVAIVIDEQSLPIDPAVNAACEMLGFDPLYVANEGKLIAFVGENYVDDVLMAMRNHRYGTKATIIGQVYTQPKSRVLLKTIIGGTRIIDILSNELMPRIC